MLATVIPTLIDQGPEVLELTSSLLLPGDVRAGVELGVVARLSSEFTSGEAK